MLVNLDFHDISLRAAIVGRDFLLLEPHAIERLCRQAVAHLRQLLGVRKGAAQALDFTRVAADVERRADMTQRRGVPHAHALARLELRRDGALSYLLHASPPLPSCGRAPPS